VSDPLPDLGADPNALRVCKKPIPVRVEFATADGVCTTLEGPVHYRAGDAILTGVRGEHWPVERDWFSSSYQPVPPTRAGENGSYSKAPSLTLALRLDQPRDVLVGWQKDPLHGQPGDWLLQYADGSYSIIGDGVFRESYAPVADETRWPPP
jgi:hypothetical protein